VATSPFVFDDAATVRVTLTDARQTLASVTAEQCRAGANEALINGHLLRFKTATYVSPGVYDLSGFLFGLRGTETFLMPGGSKFLLVRDETGALTQGWTKVFLNGADLRNAYSVTPAPFTLLYSPLELSYEFTQTLGYYSRKAISPAYLKVRSDGASGAILSFGARSRGDGADLYWLTGGTPALTDPLLFDVVLYAPATTTVVNTRRITASSLVGGTTAQLETTYTAAQLSAIFGGVPTDLQGVIYPINGAGRGIGRAFSVTMP
jgi:hypothetical protein